MDGGRALSKGVLGERGPARRPCGTRMQRLGIIFRASPAGALRAGRDCRSHGARQGGSEMLYRVAMVVSVVFLAACSTPYGERGLLGGLSERPVDKGVYEVSFRGNGLTSISQAENMVLLKSAELTLANGYQRFVLLPAGADGDGAKQAGGF